MYTCIRVFLCSFILRFVLQVRRLGEEELGGGHTVLALSLGHRDWLVLLLLWGGATEPHRRPPAAPGHRARRHHSLPAGETLCSPYWSRERTAGDTGKEGSFKHGKEIKPSTVK